MTNLDITDSLAPSSEQLDAIELVAGPRTFTIERVSKGNNDQPFNFHLVGFPRVWRPGKSMRRVIAAAWGTSAEAYIGQSVTLYNDPTIRFGNDVTGGTRISHMTGLDKPLKVSLMVSRGKFAQFTVQPLERPTQPATSPSVALDDADVAAWVETFSYANSLTQLQAAWSEATDAGVSRDGRVVAAKDARKAALS